MSETGSDPLTLPNLELLRRFEPVMRFTRGEMFHPMDVNRYIKQCSLWLQRPKELPQLLIPQGELTLEKLAEPREDGFNAVHYVKFIEPLDLLELARYSLNQTVKSITKSKSENVFHSGPGRLARVGYVSRLLDALFSVTLLMRGRVSGDTAAAAALTYQRIQAEKESYTYYGRVFRESCWLVLQYWFFYPFNNWRSGFFGVNDHEGDWEGINIYCSEDHQKSLDDPERIVPHWVAYAAHEFSGEDLRRRWDDPVVEKIGEHPVIYVGAGSHASYFLPGEYLAEIEVPFLSPLSIVEENIFNFWVNVLHQDSPQVRNRHINLFRIPFVDYARGDGLSIGPGQPKTWEASPLNPVPEWVKGYRGLWGLYAGDPISGENAPAGPRYNRDGTVRRDWYDPVGWAGLDAVAPPQEALAALECRRTKTLESRDETLKKIAEKSEELMGMGIEAASMDGQAHLKNEYLLEMEQIRSLSNELNNLRRQLTVEDAKLEAFEIEENLLRNGDLGPLRAHIRRPQVPSADFNLQLSKLAEIFAAISVGLFMVGIVLLVLLARHYLLFGLAAMIGLLIFIESYFRRQTVRMISSFTIALAIVSAVVLLFHFFWEIVVGTVLIAGLYIIWENIREIKT